MSAAERASLAQATLARELGALPEIRPGSVALAVEEAPPMVTTRVRLDAGTLPLFRLRIVPLPDTMIERRALVQQGGVL